jgi:hypothetical protein
MVELLEIINQIEPLLGQYEMFINQFNEFISINKLGVSMTSGDGIMVDCPGDVADSILDKYKLKIKVLDGVIKGRELQLKDLLDRGNILENSTKDIESFKIGTLTNKFQGLKSKYAF